MTARNLERVIYYEDYMVIDPGTTPLWRPSTLSEHEYQEARATYGNDAFVAKMGAEAVRDALAKIELEKTVERFSSRCWRPSPSRTGKNRQADQALPGVHQVKDRPDWMIPHGSAGDSSGSSPAGPS